MVQSRGLQVSMILGRNQKDCDAYQPALRPAVHTPRLASLRDSEVTIGKFGALWMSGRDGVKASEGKATVSSRSQVPANRRRKARG